MGKARYLGACAVACLGLIAVACVPPATTPANIRPVAVAAATPDSGPAPLLVSFTSAGSSDPDGTISTYAWNFGDSATSNQANPTHTYSTAGVYTVTLTVTDNKGATGSTTLSITVAPTPNQAPVAVATVTPDNGFAPLDVEFDSADSTDSDGTIVAVAWDFGDGNASTEASPTHTYAAQGVYTVTLTVTDDDGDTGTTTLTVTVAPTPNQAPIAAASATPDNGEAPLPVQFSSAGSSDSDGNIASYAWDFGDGDTSSAENPSHTYTVDGEYTVTLTVTDDDGAAVSVQITVSVVTIPNVAPTATVGATPNPVQTLGTVTFSSTGSADSDGSIVGYAWNFGDGNTSTAANPTHAYAVAGTYAVTLTVTDNEGATGTAGTSIQVNDDAAGRYVATTGTNSGTCSTSAAPCLTISYAVTQAVTGNNIYVRAGTYPEIVYVTKSLNFKGANAGVSGTATRGAESIVKGIRTGTTEATSPGSTQYDVNIDGFRIEPQGDAALLAASAKPLVWLRGGATGNSLVNNVFNGGTFAPACGFTCTTMADYAVIVNSGTVGFSHNKVENFRRPLNFTQTTATPLNLTVTDNTINGSTSRGLSFGGGTGIVMPGATISGNTIDATGRDLVASTPAGMTVSNGGNQITNNTITGQSSGVFINLCKKFNTDNNVVNNNTFANNGGGINITTILDGSQCVTGASVGNLGWIAGGGKAEGFQAHGNTFTGQTSYAIRFNPNYGTYTTVVTTGPLDVTCNYYGTPAGPSGTDGLSQGPVGNAQLNGTPWKTSAGGACDGGI